MPAVIYHILHVSSILLMIGFAFGLIVSENKKFYNIGFGITSLITFIAGFGLIHKLGYPLASSHWLWGKLLVWGLLAGLLPVLVKRTKLSRCALIGLVSILSILAVVFVYLR